MKVGLVDWICIDNYSSNDFEEVKELLVACGLYFAECDKSEIFFAKAQQDPESILVARLNGIVVGFMIIVFDPWMPFIYRLSVSPTFQRRGIAKKLISEALKRLQSRGQTFVGFLVEPNNNVMIDLCSAMDGITDYGPYKVMTKSF